MSDTQEATPSETPVFTKYRKTVGAVDYGLEYECLMSAFVALKLICSEKVKNFEITNNDARYGYFDDLVVRIHYLNGESHTFAFQLKYFSKEKPLNIEQITSNKGTINLFKMFKSFREIHNRQNLSCILFTNAKIKFDTETPISIPEFENRITVARLMTADGGEIFNTNGRMFQLETLDEKYEREFFQQLYFYSQQMKIDSLKTYLATVLSDLFQHQLLDSFLSVMKEWFSSRFILTKRDVVLKLAELAFSPFIKIVSSNMYNEQCQVLKKVIMNFDVTLVEDFNIIENIWLLPKETDRELKFWHKYALRHERDYLPLVQNLTRLKVLWYMDEIPLVLKVDDWNRSIIKNGIKLLNNHNLMKRLVLVGPSHKEFSDCQKTFTKFIDLGEQKTDLQLFGDYRVSLQTREPISLPELFMSDPEVVSAFTVDDLLQMTQNHITVGNKVTDLPPGYIPRIVSASEKPLVKEENIFAEFRSIINLISSDPGSGKSTLMASLANNCPSLYWSVFVKLPEHHSFFNRKPQEEEILSYFLGIKPKSDTLYDRVKMGFLRSRKIYLFLDGLDEVVFVDVVLNFVEYVSRTGVHVWLSSRTYLEQYILDRFHLNPISIEKFGKDQVLKYFKELPGEFPFPSEIVSITPLEMSTLAYVLSQKKVIKVATSTRIFQAFVEIKNKDCYNLEKYELLALKFCLGPQLLTKLNLDGEVRQALRDINRNGDNLKIMTKIDEDRAVFENKTYAEYFASIWLSKNISKVKLLKKFWFAEENQNLRKMLDTILAGESLLHLAVIDRNVDLARENIKDIKKKDSGGRSVLHVICSYENVDKDLLELVFEENAEKDELFAWSCLDYAMRAKNLPAIDKFLEKGKHSSEFEEFYEDQEVAFLAAQLGYPNLLSSFIQRNPDIINCRVGSEQSSLLHIAVTSKHDSVEKVIDILTTIGIDFEVKDGKNRTPLQLVLENGDCDLGQKLLSKGANVKVIGNRRRNLLHHAASKKGSNITVIDFLTDKGIDVNAKDLDGATALHIACSQGNFENVIQLLKKGADFKLLTLYGKSVLHYAITAEEPNLKLIIHLIDLGIDINSRDFEGVTALHLASKNGFKDIMDILVKKSIKDTVTDSGQTALHFACTSLLPCPNLVSSLISGEFDVNKKDKNEKTALHIASESGHYDLIKVLDQAGLDYYTCDNKGRNALHYATLSENPNTDLISLLIDHDVDIDKKNFEGKTALHLASELGHDEVVEILLNAKAKASETSKGRSALHNAKSVDVAKLLIENGINAGLEDSDGVTAFHLACQRRQFDLVQMLFDTVSATVEKITDSGRNALHFAASTCARNTEIINFLLDKGVRIIADNEGITPLHEACRFNNNYNVEVLLKKEADINALTKKNENVFHFAVENIIPNEIMLNLLLEKGVNLDQLNVDGKTPIQLASPKIADFLHRRKNTNFGQKKLP